MNGHDDCEMSGYHVGQMERLLDALRNCEDEGEAKLLRQFVIQYIDHLVSRREPKSFKSDGHLIACILLRSPEMSDDVCHWLRNWTLLVSGNADEESELVGGVFLPSLKPPIEWHDTGIARKTNCLLSFLCDEHTMRAPLLAYEENYPLNDPLIGHMKRDVAQLNDVRMSRGLSELLVNWKIVCRMREAL